LEHDYFIQLTRIENLGDIEYYNSKIQELATRVDDVRYEHLLEAYMGGLKEDMKKDVYIRYPTNIMEAMQFNFHIQVRLHISLPLEHT
jgi:hypothetical protein